MSVGKDIDYYSKFSPSPLSMKQFLDFGKMTSQTLVYFTCICSVLIDYISSVFHAIASIQGNFYVSLF